MELSSYDREVLSGGEGPANQTAMEILVSAGEAVGAKGMIDITRAHIDSCLYHGEAGLDFATLLVTGGATVKVPTTLNVATVDLLHPELYRGDPAIAERGRQLMDAYLAMGCEPTWTCAPYHLTDRPRFGEQVAWGESNAIVFANSVLGARTNRYGDFIDICCALTGRAPAAGLHTDEGRQATILVSLNLSDRLKDEDILYPLLGHLLGQVAGTEVPVIEGLDGRADEDRLKALGAAAASSGAVGMFHAVGVTPEAQTLEQALQGRAPKRKVTVDVEGLRRAQRQLNRGRGDLGAVSVGTPHASLSEMERVVELAAGRQTSVPFYLNTGRDQLSKADVTGIAEGLRAFGATIVTDTCTYITPIIEEVNRVVMTNSGKWAYYAPGNLGVQVAFGSLSDCVESAVAGEVMASEWF